MNVTPLVQPMDEQAQQSHDAGYDSYMTGSIFVKLAGKLEVNHRSEHTRFVPCRFARFIHLFG